MEQKVLNFSQLSPYQKQHLVNMIVKQNISFKKDQKNKNFFSTIALKHAKQKSKSPKKQHLNIKSKFYCRDKFSSKKIIDKQNRDPFNQITKVKNPKCKTPTKLILNKKNTQKCFNKILKSPSNTDYDLQNCINSSIKKNLSFDNKKKSLINQNKKVIKTISKQVIQKYPQFPLKIYFNLPDSYYPRLSKTNTLKQIQQIFSAFFTKNTMMFKSKKMCKQYQIQQFTMKKFIQQYYKSLNKGQKNVTNSIGALLYGMNRIDNLSSSILQKMITQQFDHNQMIFFLFARNIAIKEFKINFIRQIQQLSKNNDDIGPFIYKKQAAKLIGSIFGNKELSKLYLSKILAKMDHQIKQKFSIYHILFQLTLIYKQQKHNNLDENSQNKNQFKSVITFGQYQDNPKIYFNTKINNIELQQKMHIIIDQYIQQIDPENHVKNILMKFLTIKTMALLDAIQKEDKIQWFRVLDIQPTQQGLQQVQNIQKTYEKNPSKICRKLLSVKKLKEQTIDILSNI